MPRRYETIKEFDPDQKIVSMITFEGTVFVATTHQLWVVNGDALTPIPFELADEDPVMGKMSIVTNIGDPDAVVEVEKEDD